MGVVGLWAKIGGSPEPTRTTPSYAPGHRSQSPIRHMASDECIQVMEHDEMSRIAHATRSFLSSSTGQKKVDSLIRNCS